MERRLSPGEEHVYRIAAAVGKPLLAVVEQRGIDLEVRIEAPDGRQLAWVDSPNGPRGVEVLAVRPEVSGGHRLTVFAGRGGTVAGGYRLEASELREDSPRERARAAAELAATRAADLYRQRGRGPWQAAVAGVREALVHWRESGEEPGRAFFLLGVLHRLLDEPAPALEALERAQARFASEGDAAGVAAAWNEAGNVHRAAGRPEPARHAYDQALTGWRALGDHRGEAQALNNLGLLDHGRGELRQALERYEAAAGLFQTLGDLAQAARVQNNLANVRDLLGEPRQALEGYRAALDLLRQTGDRSQEPRVLFNLGTAHRVLGEPQEALLRYRQALDLFRLQGDRRGEGTALNGLGRIYLELGEPRRSRGLLEQALALRRETGDRSGEAATLLNLGSLLERAGEPRQALDLLRQALALQQSLDDGSGRAATLEQTGSLHLSLGDPAEAMRHFEQALALRKDPVGRARALTFAAEAWTALGDPARAREPLRQALELLRAVGYTSGEARALVVLARTERALGRPAEALARLQEAFERIEALRSRVASPDLRASYLADQRGAYELSIDVRLDLHRLDPGAGHARAALEVSERARARSLLDLLGAAGTDLPPGTGPELVRRRQALREQAGAKELRRLALLAAGAPPAKRREVERELEAILTELQLLEGETARRAAVPWPALAVSVPEIQALLAADALLLEYSLGEKRSVLWAVSAASFEVFELPGRKEIEALATRVYRRWSALDTNATGAAGDGGAAELSRILLGPVASRLGTRRLAVVPDGALHYLPFAALPHPAADVPLLVRHEVVTLPSASFLAAQRRALSSRPRPAGALALLADPVFDPRDPRVRGAAPPAGSAPANVPAGGARGVADDLPLFDRLPSSRREAETIVPLARDGEVLLALDFQARRSLLTEGRLAGFRILHFATHGTFHGEHPELSGIVLSLVDESGRPQEGFLRLPDLHGLSLAADLVVLSGCQTALGREIRGEGLVGLGRGFLDAGARNLVASLWQVPDRATAELMAFFYRGLLERGEAPAAALRQAQLAVRARRGWSEPYHWASFILLGEGR